MIEAKWKHRQEAFKDNNLEKGLSGVELRQKSRKNSAIQLRNQYISKLKSVNIEENKELSLDNPSLLVELSRCEIILSRPEPEFAYLIQMGNIKFIIDSLASTTDSSEFVIIVTNLCVFTSGPAYCTEYIQEFRIIQILLNKLDLIREAGDLAVVINLISNSLSNFPSFFEFLRSEGFLKLQKSCVSFSFTSDTILSLKFLCYNLSFYSGELGLFDGKILVNWIEQVIKLDKEPSLVLDTLEITTLNKNEFKFTSNIAEFLIAQLNLDDYKQIVKVLDAIGNFMINKGYLFSEKEFLRIFQRVLQVFEGKKLKKSGFWIFKVFVNELDVAKHILNSGNYEMLAESLADPDKKVRKSAFSFFDTLFSDDYYTSGEFTLVSTTFDQLKQGLLYSESPESIFRALKVFKKIINDGKCSKNLLTSIDYSNILDTIDTFYDHPNNSIASLVSDIYLDLSII